MSERQLPNNNPRRFPKRFAVWLSMAVIAVACVRIDPESEMTAAVDSLAAGRYREASIRLSNVIQAQPENAEAWKLRGDVALLTGDATRAAEAFERARALGMPLASLALGLADSRVVLGQATDALRILDSAAESLEDEPTYWVIRAEALVRAGRLAEAEIALASGADDGTGGTRAEIVRALIAVARNDAPAAEAVLAGAMARSPNDPALLSARGDLFARTERLPEAAADLLRAADLYREAGLDVREISALMALAQVNLASNDLATAETTALRLAQRAPQASLTAYVRGLVAYRSGELDAAAGLIQPLVNAQPDTTVFRGLLGAIHLARGNFGQAEQQFLAVLAVSPRDPAAVKLLAETRLRQQRPDAALSALKAVEDEVAQDAQLGVLNGLANLQLGNTEQGVFYLEQAASLDPTNEMLKLQLARAYLVAGRDVDASTLLRQSSLTSGEASIDARLVRLFADLRGGDPTGSETQAAALLEEFPRDARVLTAVAGYFHLRGDAPRALQLFREAALVETEGVTARMFVAASLVQDGRRAEAERLLAEVSAQQPDNAQVLTALAELRIARGAIDEAVELLALAAERTPSVMPRLVLAQLHIRTGNFAEARRQVDVALQREPDHPEVVATAGIVALAEGNTGDAVRLLQTAHEQLPARLGVTLGLARAQLAEAPESARVTLLKALEVAPRSLPLRLALGQAELQLGNAAEALSIATALKAEFPTQSSGYLLEADAEISGRRYAAAADSLAAAFEREPAWPVLARLVRALELAGQGDAAVSTAGRWVASNPEHVAGKLLLASLLQTGGRDAEALEVFEDVLTLDSENVPALNNAAWIAHSLEKPNALALAERAHVLAESNPAVLDTLGWILLTEDRATEAIEHLGRAAELAPGVPEIRYHLARALVAGGRPAEARPILTALLAGPDFEQRPDARELLDSL